MAELAGNETSTKTCTYQWNKKILADISVNRLYTYTKKHKNWFYAISMGFDVISSIQTSKCHGEDIDKSMAQTGNSGKSPIDSTANLSRSNAYVYMY